MDHETDIVITWVDGNDPEWRKKKEQATSSQASEDGGAERYRDWDLLRYWFRGIEKFAPWARHIFFITDGQKPSWLDTDHPKLRWLSHRDFMPEEYLPTFNSNAIEMNFGRISELSEHFVYFNDDMFLISKTKIEDFFMNGLPCGLPRLNLSYPDNLFSQTLYNNAVVLNRHYDFRETIRKYGKLWFSKQSLRECCKILFFLKMNMILGMSDHHLPKAFLKSSFQALWDEEEALMHETSLTKMRHKNNITLHLVRDRQFFTGQFSPQKPIGKAFLTSELYHSDALCRYIRRQKGKTICINDTAEEKDFSAHRAMIEEAFMAILPEKSSFEKDIQEENL